MMPAMSAAWLVDSLSSKVVSSARFHDLVVVGDAEVGALAELRVERAPVARGDAVLERGDERLLLLDLGQRLARGAELRRREVHLLRGLDGLDEQRLVVLLDGLGQEGDDAFFFLNPYEERGRVLYQWQVLAVARELRRVVQRLLEGLLRALGDGAL